MLRALIEILGWTLIFFALTVLVRSAYSHSGRTDEISCHQNRSTGEYHCHPSYNRDLYGDWRDTDGDCQDTRTEVLIQEADGPIQWESPRQCEIERGTWHGPYTGQTYHDPSELHVDHLVPLKEAHVSGAAEWSRGHRRAFSTDLDHLHTLMAVEAGANMSKGARDPAGWLPPNPDFRCEYVKRWIAVKERWDLAMDPEEKQAVERIQRCCSIQIVGY